MKKFKLYFSAVISVFLFLVTLSPVTSVSAIEKGVNVGNAMQSRAVGYDPIYTTKRVQIDRSDVKGYIDFCVVEHYNSVMKRWELGNYYITGSNLNGYGNMVGANFGAKIVSSSVAIGGRTGSVITLSYKVFNYKNNMVFIENSVDINL